MLSGRTHPVHLQEGEGSRDRSPLVAIKEGLSLGEVKSIGSGT